MFENSLSFAKELDSTDHLKTYREKFHIPTHQGKELVYLCGNSLGLQPKSTADYFKQELEDWAKWGVEGHFNAKNPWFSYHDWFSSRLAQLVGAHEKEVVAMNNLTVNLHLLLVSFYRPDGKRNKIIFESTAFPSDRYALESQVKFHGLNPEECLVELYADDNAKISTTSILNKIKEVGDELALVMLGGVNYYSGQFFELKEITKAAHAVGAIAGFDLAHAMGNVPLELHEWNVDFACWCSYKYLNSGPGGVAGIFVHEKYGDGTGLNRFHGWWGNNAETRFLMGKEFHPAEGAEGWQLSNAPVFNMVAHRASLELFQEVGMKALREKSILLTGYLEFLLVEINRELGEEIIEILTPSNPNERGCQLSIRVRKDGKKLFEKLVSEGIMPDWREPDVIRLSPVPLYNRFEDVWRTASVIRSFFIK
ncbi:MAG: kynureninase [Bacteroidia bacterium]|nr:kynureninase [Bacteroidia bacterium]